jgi:hypothetical protein
MHAVLFCVVVALLSYQSAAHSEDVRAILEWAQKVRVYANIAPIDSLRPPGLPLE